jgi:hypothetical protein
VGFGLKANTDFYGTKIEIHDSHIKQKKYDLNRKVSADMFKMYVSLICNIPLQCYIHVCCKTKGSQHLLQYIDPR